MDLETLRDQINGVVEAELETGEYMKHLPRLDRRAGYGFWVSPEWIATQKEQRRSLDYYGGFEYVPPEYILEAGDYIFYSREHSRVENSVD